MMLMTTPIRETIFARWRRRRGLIVHREEAAWPWLIHHAGEWLMTAVAVGLAAYIASAPLVAFHFGLFSPYASALTILLAPLITAVLVPAYLSLMLLWPLPNLAHALGQLAGFFSNVVVGAVGLMEHLPGLCIAVRPVSVGWVVLSFAVLAAWMLHRRLPWRWGLPLLLTLALAGLTAYTQRPADAPPGARLHVLAVGPGQCAVLHLPDGSTALFDAGTASGFDIYTRTLEPFLRSQRLPWPNTVFVSHAHLDHCSGLLGLIRDHPPKTVFLSPYFTADRPMEAPAQQLLALLRQRAIPTEFLHAGQRVQLDPRTHVDALWPPPDSPTVRDVNDSSLVLRVTCDHQRVLLTGDVGETPLRQLLAQTQPATQPAATAPASANRFATVGRLHADVLVLPHHGGWNNALPHWLHAVAPKHILASGSRDTTAALDPTGPRTAFYTDLLTREFFPTWRHGCVSVTFGEGKITVQTMR
jgi:competence protein ComEC